MLDVCAGGLVIVASLTHGSPSGWNKSTEWFPGSLVLALRAGRLPFVQWVLSASALDPELHASAVEHAAVSDSLDYVERAMAVTFKEQSGLLLAAAAFTSSSG